MSLTGPEPIAAEHILTGFDSGQHQLDSWLVSRALKNERAGASRTYVICDGRNVIAYYCLSAGSVAHTAVPRRIKRNMPDPIPMMLMGRLAVTKTYQGQGFAKGLVRDAILRTLSAAEIAGIRALFVCALDDGAAEFYRHMQFLPSPVDPLLLMLPVETMWRGHGS